MTVYRSNSFPLRCRQVSRRLLYNQNENICLILSATARTRQYLVPVVVDTVVGRLCPATTMTPVITNSNIEEAHRETTIGASFLVKCLFNCTAWVVHCTYLPVPVVHAHLSKQLDAGCSAVRMQPVSFSYMNMAVAGVLTFVSVAPASVVVESSEMSSQIYNFTVCCYSLGARCIPRLRRVSKNGQNASRDDGSNEHRCLVQYWRDAIFRRMWVVQSGLVTHT